MSFIFNPNEDPRQREMRLRQQQMQGLEDGMGTMPRNFGEGIASVGQALLYRQLQQRQQQAAADPWSSMREPTSSGIFGMGRGLLSGWGK